MSLTAAQILDLAPDASSRKAGQDQAKLPKWGALARQGDLIWGEIKGSGANPYRTVADLSGPASKCSCPSRKFPCKHALGLMLVEASSPDALKEGEQPDWVAAWSKNRASRAASAEAKADTPAKPVDEKAQAKRRQAREDKVSAALDELELWLRDLMRRGLASARSEPYAFWDRMAGRLVDGQAAGLARRVRALPGLAAAQPRAGAPKPEEALALAIGRLGLLVRAARRLDALSPEQSAGVRAAIGFPVAAEELAARPGHTDEWAVLAHSIDEEDKLTARSVWLVGRRSGQLAQILDFGTAGSPLPPAPASGQDFSGEIAFYPGDPPLRAVLREGRSSASPQGGIAGAGDIASGLRSWAEALARAPWTERWPLRLSQVRFGLLPGGTGAAILAVGDGSGTLPLLGEARNRALVAVAAGRPVDLFGLYDGHALSPLAIAAERRAYAVPSQDPRPFLSRVA